MQDKANIFERNDINPANWRVPRAIRPGAQYLFAQVERERNNRDERQALQAKAGSPVAYLGGHAFVCMQRNVSVRKRSIPVGASLAGLALVFMAQTASAQSATASDAQGEYVRGRILVMSRAGLAEIDLGNIVGVHGGKARAIGKSRIYIVDLPPQASETAIVQQLSRHPQLKFAELDRKVKSTLAVNDPYVGSEWHLGTIGASAAWDFALGAGVTVAILDSGIDSSHPDLAGQLVPGWNFVDNNSNTADVYGHGTAVAGTVAATSNNGIGVAGVSSSAKIMPVRVSDSTGWATYSALAQGITYAADHGARIANLSFQGPTASSSVVSAAQYMKDKNGLVFISAGNAGTQENYTPTTSAILVSATNSTDVLASFSSWGNYVSLAAPGDGIYTTHTGGSYWSCWGTSFSSPVAAAVGALVMSAKPGLTSAQVESILFSTAADLGASGRDPQYGYGRVNAYAAVKAALGSTASAPDTTAPSVAIAAPLSGSTVTGLVAVNVNATDNVGVAKVELWANGSVVATDTASPFAFTWDSTKAANGTSTLVAYAYDAAGNVAASSTVSVNASNSSPVVNDTTPPTVQIVSPGSASLSGTATVSGTVTVSATASDNSGSAGITQSLFIDGVLKTTVTGGSLSYQWNTRKVAAGGHSLQVIARDASGNSSSSSVQVTK